MSCFAIVIDTLSGGGAEQVMLRLAATLIAQGHKVKFIVINPIVSHSIPHDIELIFVRKPGLRRGWKWLYYRRTANELQKILDDLNAQQPIVALLSNLPETDRITRHLQDYLVFHCIHNSFYQSQLKNKKGRIARWIKKKRLQLIYNNKQLIFVSEGAKEEFEQLIGIIPASSQVIYNPFPLTEIQHLTNAHPIDYKNYFIHVGRFNRQKRHDKLLQIYAESGLTNPLLLIGEGNAEQTNDIKQLIHRYGLENQVVITGFQQNPFPYIHQAIALLLTSDYEGLPTVIIEALICGTPVVSYDCPSGPREILEGSLREFLIPFDDSAKFIDKLTALAANPRRVSPEDANLNRFEATNIANQYIAAVQRITVNKHL
jgi:glycosyltransferase involved in cell wall biosynthesis